MIELAVERHGPIVAEQPAHDLESFFKAGEAKVCVEHVEAEGPVLPFVPAGAEAEPEPSVGQVVYGGSLPGGDNRMPERDRRDQGPELYAAGVLRKPGERGPQLQAISVLARLIVREVIGAVEASVAEVLDRPGQPSPAVPPDTRLPLDHDRDFEHR